VAGLGKRISGDRVGQILFSRRRECPGNCLTKSGKGFFLDNYWFVPISVFLSCGHVAVASLLAVVVARFGPFASELVLRRESVHSVDSAFSYNSLVRDICSTSGWALQLFQKFGTVREYIKRIPWWFILMILCLAISLMVVEDEISISVGFPNYYKCFAEFESNIHPRRTAVLLKIPVRLAPSFIDVRQDSYGIYLTHQIVGFSWSRYH